MYVHHSFEIESRMMVHWWDPHWSPIPECVRQYDYEAKRTFELASCLLWLEILRNHAATPYSILEVGWESGEANRVRGSHLIRTSQMLRLYKGSNERGKYLKVIDNLVSRWVKQGALIMLLDGGKCRPRTHSAPIIFLSFFLLVFYEGSNYTRSLATRVINQNLYKILLCIQNLQPVLLSAPYPLRK